MRISELAASTGSDVETIRYYERVGMLPAPPRTAAGYRVYGPAHKDRLRFIRHCRALQMSLAEIRVLLDMQAAPAAPCQEVNDLLDQHIVRVQEQIDAMLTLQSDLVALRRKCDCARSVQECAIMHDLSEPATNSRDAATTIENPRVDQRVEDNHPTG